MEKKTVHLMSLKHQTSKGLDRRERKKTEGKMCHEDEESEVGDIL